MQGTTSYKGFLDTFILKRGAERQARQLRQPHNRDGGRNSWLEYKAERKPGAWVWRWQVSVYEIETLTDD